ncbi:MAG: response regulator receiver protein [Atopobiaceae bacterium]|nr:response regulator receiver protein [Atopobiaceae bacterium]
MAFDPQREDYQRLGLRFARSLKGKNAAQATREFITFGRRFAQDRDSLPQSDSDRAFHLVTLASRRIDYELPFADEQRAHRIIDDGHRILEEAISLDPHCYDAIRMKSAAASSSFDAFLTFLNERSDEVRTHCEEQRAAIPPDEPSERARLMANIAMRPYLRWVATQAEEALICGRNRESLRLAHKALELDPSDMADVRFTAALAYAKLEDESGLQEFIATRQKTRLARPSDDAWTRLALLSLAFKRHDLEEAIAHLDKLLDSYPHAAEALIRQNELPEGVFARLAVAPYSEDEIILALSEATVLLQEGIDLQGRGVLSTWLIQETARKRPQAMLAVLAQQANDAQSGR